MGPSRQLRVRQNQANHESFSAREVSNRRSISPDIFTTKAACHAQNLAELGDRWKTKEKDYFLLFGSTFR